MCRSSGDGRSNSPAPWDCANSPQSTGGPRAGEQWGGSSGSPRCVRIWFHAVEAILAYFRLRTSGSKEPGACRPSAIIDGHICRKRSSPVGDGLWADLFTRHRDRYGHPRRRAAAAGDSDLLSWTGANVSWNHRRTGPLPTAVKGPPKRGRTGYSHGAHYHADLRHRWRG